MSWTRRAALLAGSFIAGIAAAQDAERVSLNGVEISELEVRRALIEMRAAELLDDLQLRSLIAQAIERIAAEGVARWEYDAFGEMSIDALIDAVFFPEDVARWPDHGEFGITLPAEREQFRAFRARLARVRAGDPTAKPPIELEMQIVRGKIRNGLLNATETERCMPLLPADVCMIVGSQRLRVGEVWPRIAAGVSAGARRAALRWAAVARLLERELGRAGALLEATEFRQRLLREHGKPATVAFSLQNEGLERVRAPSVDAYRHYLWLLESYRRMVADELDIERLEAWVRKNAALFGGPAGGKANAEVILFSAWDFAAWTPRAGAAREGARERAEACWRRLQAGEDFAKLLDELSEYEDIPYRSLLAGATSLETHKGRFGEQDAINLGFRFGEAPFEALVSGQGLHRRVLQEIEIGAPQGPFPCGLGWALVRVLGRTESSLKIDLGLPANYDEVRQLVSEHLFLEWAAKLVSEAEIRIH